MTVIWPGSQARWQSGHVQGRACGPRPLQGQPRCRVSCHFYGCAPRLSSLQGKKILGGGGNKTTLPEGPLWTQCQPETAADGEQQHQGPTVPSCPSSSAATPGKNCEKDQELVGSQQELKNLQLVKPPVPCQIQPKQSLPPSLPFRRRGRKSDNKMRIKGVESESVAPDQALSQSGKRILGSYVNGGKKLGAVFLRRVTTV